MTYTHTHIKQITNKDLLHSTVNSTQYSVMTYLGKGSKKEWICVYVYLIHLIPGVGHGNPLQDSCLENLMDRGAWWATVHRVTKSRT